MRLGLFLLLISAAVRAETVLVLGDSLSAAYNIPIEDGWVRLLERRLAADGCRVEVVNASISGETSLGGLNRLPKLLQDHQPSVVIVELGANDGLRGFSPETLHDNLRAIVTHARTAGARVVITGIRVPTNYGPRYGEQFAAVFERVSAERDVPLVPFLLDGVALDPDMIQADGVHPTAAAQPRILDNVWPALVSQLDGCPPAPEDAAELVPFDSDRWRISAEDHRVEIHLGRPALFLKNGQAWIDDLNIVDGTIAFDLAFGTERGFSGGLWRRVDGDNFEEFYLRPHQSGNPDANQYTPIFNGNASWQLYHGPGYGAPVGYRYDQWIPVEIRFSGARGEVLIDSEEPVLTIDPFKHPVRAGKVGVMSGYAPAYFSNFRVSRTDPGIARSPTPASAPRSGAAPHWLVSDPFSMARLGGGEDLGPALLEKRVWQLLDAEPDGIANLARRARLSEGHDTVLARAVVESAAPVRVRLRFGYSDNARLFLNGRPIYQGSNAYRSRDYRYLGTIGLFDAAFLDLEAGDNEIVFAVQENFGGWGILAELAEATGVEWVTEARDNRRRAGEAGRAIAELVDDGFVGSVLVARGERPIFSRDAGFDPAPVGVPSYWVASITKQFTAAGIALLAERGRLELDDPISQHLPDVPADKRGITIFHLLTHTSGLAQTYAADGIADKDQALAALLRPNLTGRPGAEFAYANDNYNLLAILLETVAKVPYEEFLRRELFAPAGMTHSGSWTEPIGAGTQVPPSASGFADGDPNAAANWGFRGATGMRASVGDLLAWVGALRQGRALSRQSVAEMLGPHLVRPSGIGIGFHWFSTRDADGTRAHFMSGSESFGGNALVYWYPERDLTIVTATNAGPAETGDGPVEGWSRRAHHALARIYVTGG